MTASSQATERTTIARRAGLVAAGTLTSRILGAVRDAVIAAMFTVGATDAFWMAFTIPNALRVLLGEGAVSGAFVPVLTEAREKEGAERARQLYGRLAGAMLLVLSAVTLLGVIFAPALVTLYASGYRDDPELFATTITLARLVFPYILFMGAAALVTGALNALKRFAAPAFAPALLNVALIASPFVLVPVVIHFGLPAIAALAIGALVGGALQLGAQLPSLARSELGTLPRLNLQDPYVKKAFGLMVPLLAALGVYQLNIILSRQLASYLPEGSLSYLYYGQRLVEIPQGMFALAIATASLPTLSETVARGDHEAAKRTFRDALRLNLFVGIPATVALMVLAEPTVAILFGRGAFGEHEIIETGRSLFWLAAGIWAVASVRGTVPMFHAYNDTRTPVIASAVNLVVFGVVAGALMGPMQHAGLAVAISAASAAQLATLLLLLRRKAGDLHLPELGRSAARVAVAGLTMGLVVGLLAQLGSWREGGNLPLNLGLYPAIVVVGLGVYLATARALGAEEVGDILGALSRRLRRRR